MCANLGCMRAAYIQWDIHVNVTGGDGSSGLRCRRWRAVGLGRSAGMTPHASPPGRFSKPIVLRDRAPLATLDEARAFLATLSPARITPANPSRSDHRAVGSCECVARARALVAIPRSLHISLQDCCHNSGVAICLCGRGRKQLPTQGGGMIPGFAG